jgi:BirA family biotin operon repressor/biotin-[acetyl-CoA-carboxylase] ligase
LFAASSTSYLNAMENAEMLRQQHRRLRADSPNTRLFLGDAIHWLDETGSTNDECRRLTDRSSGRSVVVLADRQTAGRGQYGRTWQAPSGLGVLMSFSVPGPPPESALLTAWASVAIARTLEQSFGLAASVKWPNDVLVNGRKIAGVLVEVSGFAVVGIGLNVLQQAEQFPPDCRFPPTSVAVETNTHPNRVEAAAALLDELERFAAPSLSESQERIFAAWREHSMLRPGDIVTANLHDGSIAGELLDLHPRNGLRMRIANGVVRIPAMRLLRIEPLR